MKECIDNFNARRVSLIAPALLALLLSAGGVAVRAQDAGAMAQTPDERSEQQARRGAAGLLRVLNLTPEQRGQIRAIRRETEIQGRALGMRLRQARRALDEAIYADNPDDRVIEERVREVGAAQAAVLRMRALTELKIRRVLSPEQLQAFRRLQSRPRRRQQEEQHQQQRQRMNQTPPPGGFPARAPLPLGERMRRGVREPQETPPAPKTAPASDTPRAFA
jgi:Spy/CpxP family protein refolding chaperone